MCVFIITSLVMLVCRCVTAANDGGEAAAAGGAGGSKGLDSSFCSASWSTTDFLLVTATTLKCASRHATSLDCYTC
ncbi:hypothetical protein BDY21DRAFT_82893 [Lineolata rhizophorae]|uniref:Secreted protein n=1 Tax=Lineolata rhizophorae TaxID=578093 RepID=A0A6A6PBH6_9PEZI|nr:hypothetical protein BDY21DRAFT_82893 [Lineolata rhizophorae]